MTLADMAPTGRCRIIGAAIEHRDFQSRLYALGLYPGVWVDVLHISPFGDPLQIKVGHTLLSIRKREARLVDVELDS
jgi:ferrous iron transport protein A